MRRISLKLKALLERFEGGRLTLTKTPECIRLAKKGELARVLQHSGIPDFGRGASCEGLDTELFFSESKSHIARAKAVCLGCPIIRECATWAIKHEEFGVFGGLSAKERHVIRGGQPVTDTSDLENIRADLQFILRASAREIALRFGVDIRTVVRWRNILRPLKEVV